MSPKISAMLMKWLAVTVIIAIGAVGSAAYAAKAQTGSTAVTKKKSRVTASRRQKKVRRATTAAPAATAQDPAANTGTGEPKATQVGAELNNKGEVGAQAEDPTRGSNKSDPKFVPTPVPAAPAKPGQPAEQAGQPAPTPQPRKP